MKRCSGPVTVTLAASIWRQFGVERLPGYMISARTGTEVLEMQASTIRLILLLAFTVAVVAAAFALTRGFYIETVAEAAQKKDGSPVFYHKCKYLSFRGTRDVDSVFPSSTYQEAEKAACPYFEN